MQFVDTQIVSYAFKEISSVSVVDQHISSVVANEFLETYSTTETSANYYIPTSLRYFRHYGLEAVPSTVPGEFRKRGFSKQSTDRLALYFGQDYPSLVEYGSIAISRLINARALNVFRLAIAQVDKRKQRRLIQRFEFLSDHRITCIPLQPTVARLGQSLLYRFVKKYKLKKNFRNSFNDMLILAVAIDHGAELLTRDSLLVNFCADCNLVKKHKFDEWIRCETTTTPSKGRGNRRESKGYINRSWSVRQKRGMHVDSA